MKYILTTFNKTTEGRLRDGWVSQNLVRGIDSLYERSENIDDADIVIFVRLWEHNFKFDMEKFSLFRHKPFIVFDYIEYGPQAMHREEYLCKWDIMGFHTDNFFRKIGDIFQSKCDSLHRVMINI